MRLSSLRYAFGISLLLLLTFIPVFTVEQPLLADYPNHLARVHIWLTHNSPQPPPGVNPVWALQPNMALEIVTALISSVIPLEYAGKIFILLTISSIAIGPAILGREIYGSFSTWHFLPILLTYNRLFFWGFLGYLFSVGVAIGIASQWVKPAPKSRRAAWFFTASLSAFLVLSLHLYGFAVLVLVAITLTLRSASALAACKRDWFRDVFYKLAPLAAPLPIFALGAPVFQSNYATEWGPFIGKITSFGGLFIGPNTYADMAILSAMIAIAAIAIWKGALRQQYDKWLIGGVFLATFVHLLMPTKLFSSYGADQRLPIAIALLCIAIAPPQNNRTTKIPTILLACLLAAFTLRVQLIRTDWLAQQKIHKELTQTYKLLPQRSSVIFLVGTSNQNGLPRIPLTEHAGFAVIARNIFWPGLFAYPIHGAQTISFADPSSVPKNIAALQKIPLSIFDDVISGKKKYDPFYLDDLPSCAEYIVVIREDSQADRLPNTAVFGTMLHQGKSAAIYTHKNYRKCIN